MMNNKIIKHYLLITAFLLVIWVNCQGSFLTQAFAKPTLSGNVSLTLEDGLWKSSGNSITYQDITLDLVCEQSRCEDEVWGFAPQFNQADHQGKLIVTPFFKSYEIHPSPQPPLLKETRGEQPWRLQVDLTISRDPWLSLTGKATYTIQVKKEQNQLIGTYSGTFQDKSVSGEVQGIITPHYPTPIPNHRPIEPQEHPRLIFRRDQIPDLQRKAKTRYGKAILTQLKNTLAQPISYQGYVPNGGYHAAGYCLLFILNQDQQAAAIAWQLVKNSINQPGSRLFEQSPIVAGVALAYDLCYEGWTQEQINTITPWLAQQTAILIEGEADRGWNPKAWSNWSARARGAAGLAALTIFDAEFDPPLPPQIGMITLLKIAERNIIRFLNIGIGDHGFGSEGDHYTTEPLILAVIPFLQAYQNVMGKNLVKRSSAEWFLPHYLIRGVEREETLSIPTYGRHRRYAGGSLFAMGLRLVPEKFLPGVMWGFNRYWGMQGDKTFGITSPYQVAYLLMGYPDHISLKNPAKVLSWVLVDEQKGFYVFRNRWRNKDDFVASIYLKREALPGSWSFPDAGSFRIWGLGENWAIAGPSDGKRESENVVIRKQGENPTTQPIFFQSLKNGSGVVSLEGDNWIRSFAVDYSKKSGFPGLFVVVDKFTNHGSEQTWVMHTEGKVILSEQQFIIKKNSGTTMQGTFISPETVKLSCESTEKGAKILAKGGNQFFVVMTVQSKTSPEIEVSGKGLNAVVKVGNKKISFEDNKIIIK